MSATVTTPPRQETDAERVERARQHAREARALVDAGKLDTVVDRIMDRFPKVMDRLAK